MQAREHFHKVVGWRLASGLGLALALIVASGCGPGDAASAAEEPGASSPRAAARSVARPPAGHAWVIFGSDTVVAEVAATADERAEGLMYREAVPDGTGMLFVFPDSRIRSFWMANTYVPLDLAYMDAGFEIVDLVQMEPLVTDSYPSRAPAMYGLEVRQGWFAENGIGVGTQAEVVFGAQAPIGG